MLYTPLPNYWAVIKAAGSLLFSIALAINLISESVEANEINPDLKKRPDSTALASGHSPEKDFSLAKMAAEQGEYYKAIDLLESILQKRPELANIRLELGTLYNRVGDYNLAEQYINEAILSPEIPEDIKFKAQAMLDRVEDANNPHSFSSNVSLSALYDSNANAGPVENSIILNDIEQQLSEDTLEKSDKSLEAIAAIKYYYDLQGEDIARLETGLLSYNRFYEDFSRLHTNVLDANAGVRVKLGNRKQFSHSIKPYVGINTTYLGQDKYKVGKAIGLNYHKPLKPRLHAEVDIKVEEQDYSNKNSRSQTSLRSGQQAKANGRLSYEVTPSTVIYKKAGFSRRDSEADFESFDEISLGFGIKHVHKATGDTKPATTSLSVDWRNTNYDEADTIAGFSQSRQEKKTSTRLSNSLPMGDNASFNTSISYTNNESDITLYDYDNWGASIGVSFATY